jgi:hypothetical protein
VKLRIFIAHELNRPDHHRGRLTLTVISTCENQATPSSTPTTTGTPGTATPTATATPTVTSTTTGTPEGETDCTGADPQPKGMKLAEEYGVPYEEIMYWFCQHFGFGEIDLAYGMSRDTGISVTEIFDMRKSGLGWGEIKKQLDSQPKPTKKPKPNKP